jgi:SAM-dependent methyltransferase
MDKEYWDKFYSVHSSDVAIKDASTFAVFCQSKFFKNDQKSIVELGCGNARDAYYMAEQGHDVLAVDQSISDSVRENKVHNRLQFLEDDFIQPSYHRDDIVTNEYHPDLLPVDVFYSRFTIHSITSEEQDKLLRKVFQCLRSGGLFCIEVRTTKDPKFGIGKHISDTTYFNDGHTRRFIDSQEFLNEVLSLDFKLKYFNEQDNLSVYKDDNPVLLRIILEK